MSSPPVDRGRAGHERAVICRFMVIAGARPGVQLQLGQVSLNRVADRRNRLGNPVRAVFARAKIDCIITADTQNPANFAQRVPSERIRENLTRYLSGREPLGFVEPELGY